MLNEGSLFGEAAQRKALQAELDEIRVHRSRVRSISAEWQAAAASGEALGPARAEMSEALGRQDALLLASKALLLRTHARLEEGIDSETEIALLRVWLEDAAAAVEEFQGVVQLSRERGGRREDRPVADPAAGPPIMIYEDFLKAPCPYDSGDFLDHPADLLQPRFVPEMIHTDPRPRRRATSSSARCSARSLAACATASCTNARSNGNTVPTRRTWTSAGGTASSACPSRRTWAAKAGPRSSTTC